jgi:hypothetical protein
MSDTKSNKESIDDNKNIQLNKISVTKTPSKSFMKFSVLHPHYMFSA